MKNHLLGVCSLISMCIAGCSFGDDNSRDECGSSQYLDSKGNCVTKKIINETCSDHSECTTGLCTNDKVCGCQSDEQCSSQEACLNSMCVKTTCSVTSDCPANNVCDAGSCRRVVDCPDGDGKCFKSVQLTAPMDYENQWNVGPLTLLNKEAGDYLGSAYEVVLPKKYAITCKSLIDFYQDSSNTKYCDLDGKADECEHRKNAACFQLDMEELIPFTLRKKSNNNAWYNHDIYFVMNVGDSGLMSDDETFTLHMASAPDVTTEHLGTHAVEMNKTTSGAEIVAKYEVKKCSTDYNEFNIFKTDALPKAYKNCDEAYQFLLEAKHKTSKPNWSCDPLYNNIMGCNNDLCNFAKECTSSTCELTKSCVDNAECTRPYGFMYTNFADPTDKTTYWHTCRTAKVNLNSITVYIAVPDSEISKGK